MNNKIKIGNIEYPLSIKNNRKSILYVNKNKDNKIISIYIECFFDNTTNSDITPSFVINNIDIDNLDTLNSFSYEVTTPEISYEREDSLYYNESEPFTNYKLIINDYTDCNASITIKGNAIIDGYSDPYKTLNIEFNGNIPVKVKKEAIFQFNACINKKLFFYDKVDIKVYDDKLEIYNKNKLYKLIPYNEIDNIIVKDSFIINLSNYSLSIYKVPNDICNKLKSIINK